MKLLTKIASLCCLSFLTACASNNNVNSSTSSFLELGSCSRASSSDDVLVTEKNFVNAENQSGCYGSSNALCDVRIYQIMVESFKHSPNGPDGYQVGWGSSEHGGNLQGIIESLDYIKSLGVNALWLTPVFASVPIKGQDYTYDNLDATGYYTSDYFTIDPNFGSKEDLITLVNKAHALGMYVFLDGVFGHAKANVVTKSPDGNTLYLTRRCRNQGGSTEFMGLNLARCIDTKKSLPFLKEVATYWIKEAKIDGFRLDQAYQLAPNEWQEIYEEVTKESAKASNSYELLGKTVTPLGFMVAEVWAEKPVPLESNIFVQKNNMSAFDFPLRTAIASVFMVNRSDCGYGADLLAKSVTRNRSYSKPGITTSFVGNHDLPRIGDLLQRAGYNKDGQYGNGYYKAHKAIFSFLASLSGPISLYYGEELGAEVKGFIHEPAGCAQVYRCDDHVSRSEVDFTNLSQDAKDLKNYVSQVFKLRDKHKALSHGKRVHVFSDNSLYADFKSYENDKMLYLLNIGTDNRAITLDSKVIKTLGLTENCTLINAQTSKKHNITSKINVNALSGDFYEVRCK